MPTHRGLWRNLETPKQNEMLRRLSANWRRPRGTGHGERMDATVRRLGASSPFASRIVKTHRIALVEHDYPKAGDAARTSYFSLRIPGPGDGSGSWTPLTLNYDGTNTITFNVQNVALSAVYAANGSYEAVVQPGAGDYAGRRRVNYPLTNPRIGPGSAETLYGGGAP